MIRIIAAGLLLSACAAAPQPQPSAPELASMPPEQPLRMTPVQITGDYAGRNLRLTLDGRVVHEGRAEAKPDGERWIEEVGPGASPADLILELEGCAVYRSQIFRTGVLHAVAISGCNVTLIGA